MSKSELQCGIAPPLFYAPIDLKKIKNRESFLCKFNDKIVNFCGNLNKNLFNQKKITDVKRIVKKYNFALLFLFDRK